MANMSYCRFENTLRDLRDCYHHLGDGDLSKQEQLQRQALLGICAEILECWGYVEDDGNLTPKVHSDTEMRELFRDDFEGYDE